MMGKIYPDPFERVSFRCGCEYNFDAAPDDVIDVDDRPWHPFAYRAKCPECSQMADQAQWEVALYKARSHATGPKTPPGIAATTRNLEGHPTREESIRTRFNAMKHGLSARVATYFPSKPGKYPHCNGCEFFKGCEKTVACMKRTELYMRHHIAFETRDPSLLTDIRAQLQANIQAIIDDIVLSIIQDGVRLKSPRWYYDSEGTFHLAEYVDSDGNTRLLEEINAHPLLKTLGDLISKNGMTLGDEAMTMRQQDGSSDARDTDNGVTPEEMRDFQRRNEEQMSSLMSMIKRSESIIDVTPQSNG